MLKFIWPRKKENDDLSWVKWKYITKPKEEGGLGLKNIHHFGKVFAKKNCGDLSHKKYVKKCDGTKNIETLSLI